MKPQKIVLYPFDGYLTGADSRDSFKKWASETHKGFRHDLNVALPGDILLFSHLESPGNWIIVGEAIVDDNHPVKSKFGSCFVCDLKSPYDDEFKVHVLTNYYQPYPKEINAKMDAGIKLGRFAILTSEEYDNLHHIANA